MDYLVYKMYFFGQKLGDKGSKSYKLRHGWAQDTIVSKRSNRDPRASLAHADLLQFQERHLPQI